MSFWRKQPYLSISCAASALLVALGGCGVDSWREKISPELQLAIHDFSGSDAGSAPERSEAGRRADDAFFGLIKMLERGDDPVPILGALIKLLSNENKSSCTAALAYLRSRVTIDKVTVGDAAACWLENVLPPEADEIARQQDGHRLLYSSAWSQVDKEEARLKLLQWVEGHKMRFYPRKGLRLRKVIE